MNEKYLEEYKQLGKSSTSLLLFHPSLNTTHSSIHRYSSSSHPYCLHRSHRLPFLLICPFHFVNVVIVVIDGRHSLIERWWIGWWLLLSEPILTNNNIPFSIAHTFLWPLDPHEAHQSPTFPIDHAGDFRADCLWKSIGPHSLDRTINWNREVTLARLHKLWTQD